MQAGIVVGGRFVVRCYGSTGELKWHENIDNLVVNEGLQYMLDTSFMGSAQVSTLFLGLAGATPSAGAAHTLAVHSGWTEVTAYSGNRKEWVKVRSSQTLSNSASKGSFSIDTNDTTCGGALVSTVSTGTAGKLICVGAFTGGNKTADSGDTVEVQYDFTAADDGS